MVLGKISNERIQLNNDLMWPGDNKDLKKSDGDKDDLKKIGELLL
jgi:alpha-L-fucosidase 2